PAHAGHRRTAEVLDQPVVPAAAAERRLGADALVVRLERGAAVVVETPNDGRVDVERHAPRTKVPLHRFEVRPSVVAEQVEGALEGTDELLVARVLAVEDAHRVESEAFAAG